MRKNARYTNRRRRAFLCLLPIFFVPWPGVFADVTELRVAAIIATEGGSKALIESRDGEQQWYGLGDTIAGATITAIAEHEILLEGPGGRYRLPLRGDPTQVAEPVAETPAPPSRHQAREFQFLGLLSEINNVGQAPGESYEEATARTLNSAIGLGPGARITAVGRVQVATAEEARRELQRQLGASEAPVRITLDDDELDDLYLMPQ